MTIFDCEMRRKIVFHTDKHKIWQRKRERERGDKLRVETWSITIKIRVLLVFMFWYYANGSKKGIFKNNCFGSCMEKNL